VKSSREPTASKETLGVSFHTIALSLGSATATVALEYDAAPQSCRALGRLLPVTTTAHYAKIAGHEFYVHLPLFLEPEQRRHVGELAEGAVAFWPERQLLCVYYGRIQDEDATVTRLGRVVGNLSGLAAAAEVMRAALGVTITQARLSVPGGDGTDPVRPISQPAESDLARELFAAYTAIRDAPPPEVQALLARRGVMRPAGQLLAGEAEARKLHEVAWLIRGELLERGTVPDLAAPLLRHFAHRLSGWYGLPDAGRLVAATASHLPSMAGRAAVEAVEGLILFVGRLSLWLDAFIPWDAINGLLHRMASAPRAVGGGG
jgi:hypothetical protein